MLGLARTAPRRAALLAVTVLAFGVVCSPAPAQTPAKSDGQAASEQVIVTNVPGGKSRIRLFLEKILGRHKRRSLETSGSEVVSVPKTQTSRFRKRLEALGAKVIVLREKWNHILRRSKEPVAVTPKQQAVVDTITKSPETVNLGILKMPDPAVVELALEGHDTKDVVSRVVLPLSDGADVTLLRTRPTDKTAGGFTWSGEVEGTGERAVLMLWRDGHLSGYFGYKGHVYTVNQVAGEVHAMAEIDPGKLPADHSSAGQPKSEAKSEAKSPRVPPEPKIAEFPEAERQALEAKNITIDVMLLYSKSLANYYIRDPADLLALAIEQANQTFRNSGLGSIRLRLVHSQAIDYANPGGDQFEDLYRMVDGEGPFKDIKRLRDEKHADIVGLIIDNPKGCGLSTRVGADAEEAYFVVHHACAAITYSIAHEIGHILGARHDRLTDVTETPFAYAHGYINGTKWRDMMSYQEGCGGCPRIPYWSNPRILFKGEPTGTDASDNARVILEQAERVSKFR
jgi:hypothetical protein